MEFGQYPTTCNRYIISNKLTQVDIYCVLHLRVVSAYFILSSFSTSLSCLASSCRARTAGGRSFTVVELLLFAAIKDGVVGDSNSKSGVSNDDRKLRLYNVVLFVLVVRVDVILRY